MIKLLSKKNFIPEILIVLFPIALISGPLVPEIFVLIINIFFLINIIIKKDYNFLDNKLIYIISIFVLYVTSLSLFSDYSDQIFLKNIFYFRFILFILAIYYFLNKNTKFIYLIFYSLIIMFIFLIVDGYYQFAYDKNLLGYPKYRSDRISSFFEDKLVLGSFISRYFFIIIALYFYLKNKFSDLIIIPFILLSFVLIVLTGERSALFLTIIGLIVIFILLDIKFLSKLIIILSAAIILSVSFKINYTLYDRYINQTKSQISFSKNFDLSSFFDRFKYYKLSWNTALNGFKENKIFGQGPKSFKYFCSQPKFVTYSSKKSFKYNNIQYLDIHKKFINVEITEIFFKVGDVIENNNLLLKYRFKNKDYKFYSNKEGKINFINIANGNLINSGHQIFTLDLTNFDIPEKSYFYRNGCTTHPHQLYLQLMSETGLIGTIYIFSIFLFIIYLFIKHLIIKIFYKEVLYNNTKLCVLTYFFLLLFPMTTFGNFFNNWFIMSFSLQLGLLLYFFIDKKNETK